MQIVAWSVNNYQDILNIATNVPLFNLNITLNKMYNSF